MSVQKKIKPCYYDPPPKRMGAVQFFKIQRKLSAFTLNIETKREREAEYRRKYAAALKALREFDKSVKQLKKIMKTFAGVR